MAIKMTAQIPFQMVFVVIEMRWGKIRGIGYDAVDVRTKEWRGEMVAQILYPEPGTVGTLGIQGMAKNVGLDLGGGTTMYDDAVPGFMQRSHDGGSATTCRPGDDILVDTWIIHVFESEMLPGSLQMADNYA